jgi:hypothetical protein
MHQANGGGSGSPTAGFKFPPRKNCANIEVLRATTMKAD